MSFGQFPYQRINVVGTSGSGKSTFARRLAELLSIPHIEMDTLFWRPNWKNLNDEEFCSTLEEKLSRGAWVLDGNYTRTAPVKWANVECVIWLDYSFPRTLYQAIGRALQRSITKEELWPGTGNRESFRRTFLSRESVILWTIQTWKKNRKKYEALMNDPQYERIHFIRLRSHSETDAFLDSVFTEENGEN